MRNNFGPYRTKVASTLHEAQIKLMFTETTEQIGT